MGASTWIDDGPSRLPGDGWTFGLWLAAAWIPMSVWAAVPLRYPSWLGLVAASWWLPTVARWFEVWLDGPGLALATFGVWATSGLLSAAALRRGHRWPGVALAWITLGGITWNLAHMPWPEPRAGGGPTRPGPLVVLVTLDTVRADHLGRIGGPGVRYAVPTPHLDALMDRGVTFHRGVAPAPLTGPSHAGMLTGRPPLDLSVRRNGDPLDVEVQTVAETLATQGFRTGAFLASAVLDRRVGLDQGFQHYDDRFGPGHRVQALPPYDTLVWSKLSQPARQRTGDQVVARALRWLREAPGTATFLWVHLYDAHAPYDPEESAVAALAEVGPPVGSVDDVAAWRTWRREHMAMRSLPGLDAVGRDVSGQVERYAAEIVEVDRWVGRLVSALPPDTSWVVASDHGESLTEHGYVLNHGRHTFEDTIHVPIIVVGNGFSAGTEILHPVPSWLVGGTLTALAGGGQEGLLDALQSWPTPIESLAPGQEARPSFQMGGKDPELAVREGDRKWILSGRRRWRFQLDVDPEERHPVLDDDPDVARRYEDILEGERGGDTPGWLEALGYVDP